MPLMNWEPGLDIGVEAMNDDHREILDAMNAIYDARARNQAGATVNLLVNKLGDICKRHFADEEAFMRSIAFPGFDTHRMQHEKLLAKYVTYADDIRTAGGVAGDDFFNFLRFWLSSHIRGIDMKYAVHAGAAPVSVAHA